VALNQSSTLIGGSLNEEKLTNEILIQLFIRFEGSGHDYSDCWHKLSR
jgi:hypothetical protein